ncbi:MAG: hypothetical protein SGJ20_07670 [Planctomycetota bacterium]|nr:hypothetical protein [Planctomycetota bacterium]
MRRIGNCWFVIGLMLAMATLAAPPPANGAVGNAKDSKAASKQPGELTLTTERAVVFKDGYALIIKKGVAKTNANGEVYTDDVPDAAVLGSFWAVPKEGRMISMTAGWKETETSEQKEAPCTQLIEILEANQGKRAKVELNDKKVFSGIIHQVVQQPTTSAIDRTAFDALTASHAAPSNSARVPRPGISESITMSGILGTHFVLRTDDGDVLLNIGQVETVTVKDMKTTLAKTAKISNRTKRLSFKLDTAEKEQEITLMYFSPGMRWIPTYRVALHGGEKKTAKISLQAELLNELEDLKDTPVDIVVGVPNFRFRETPSPLSLEGTLRNALAQAAPVLMGNFSNGMSNAMYSQRSGEIRRIEANANAAAANGVVQLPDELTASGAQDLFIYNLPKITLAKSDRIAVPIFTHDVPYRDVYTWNVRTTKVDRGAAPTGSSANSPLTLSTNEVWHQIELTNNTNLPWTTGAAMIMQGNQPLAQELLTYTPPKNEVRVPLTVSVDTRGSLTEKETGRELNSMRWEDHTYAKIQKEVAIDLCNNKPIDIEVEIKLQLGGKVDKAADDGAVTINPFNAADWSQYRGDSEVNNSSTVVWKTKLKPGDTFKPTVQYHYFIQH